VGWDAQFDYRTVLAASPGTPPTGTGTAVLM
jgi:hypothetical protein